MAYQGEDGNTGLQSVSDPVEDETSSLPAIVPEDGGEPSGGGGASSEVDGSADCHCRGSRCGCGWCCGLARV